MRLGEITIDAAEMARLLALSGKEIYELRRAGVLVRANGDRFHLEASITGYVEFLRKAQGDERKLAH